MNDLFIYINCNIIFVKLKIFHLYIFQIAFCHVLGFFSIFFSIINNFAYFITICFQLFFDLISVLLLFHILCFLKAQKNSFIFYPHLVDNVDKSVNN